MNAGRRPSTIAVSLALALALVHGAAAAAAAPQVLHVATDGNDQWSGRLAAPSGTDGPLASLAAAQARVRTWIAAGMNADITVLIRSGEYPDTALYFGAPDAGRNGYQVIWKSYPGERPLIHGGRRLTGWQELGAGLFRVPVAGWVFHTLYENGLRSFKARHPNPTAHGQAPAYSRSTAVAAGADRRRFGFSAADMPFVADTRELEVVLWPAGPDGIWNWIQHTFTVEDIDYRAALLTLGHETCCGMVDQTPWMIGVGSRFYVQGAVELLDQPGEFWLGGGFLHYRPRQMPIEQQTIIAPGPVDAAVFNIEAATATDFALGIEGLDIAYTRRNRSAIRIANGRNITVRANRIYNTGGNGIEIAGSAADIVVDGNLIHDLGFDGINVYGERTIGHPTRIAITDNHIHHAGQLRGDSNGISVGRASATRIAHNRVHDLPRAGIRVFGSAEAGPAGYDAANNAITFNDVSDAVTDSQDGGLMHLSGVGPGTLVHGNRLHHSAMPFSFGYGLYLDVCNVGAQLTHNLIDGLQASGLGGITFSGIDLKGMDLVVENNVIAHNRISRGAIGINAVDSNCPGMSTGNIGIRRNIVADNGTASIYAFTTFDPHQLAAADFNLFQHAQGRYEVGFGYGDSTTTFSTFTLALDQWRVSDTRGFDVHSFSGDPGFVDAAGGDLRLHPSSSAYTLGFRDLDFASMGLTESYPFADPGDTVERLHVGATPPEQGATLRISEGGSAQLRIRARTRVGYLIAPAAHSLEFSSDRPEVAAVDASGRVTGHSAGSATIQVSMPVPTNPKSTKLFIEVRKGIDCLLDWGEDTYPELFRPSRVGTQASDPYLYRFYEATRTYLGMSSADGHLYYLGPLSRDALLDLGPVAEWSVSAGCH